MQTPELILNDKGLAPYQDIIMERMQRVLDKEAEFTEGGQRKLSEVACNYLHFGLHKLEDKWVIREWAPNAEDIYLIGDFNDWRPHHEWRFWPIGGGQWELQVPLEAIKHHDLYKLLVHWSHSCGERIPSHCKRVVQDDETKVFSAQVWAPEEPYQWRHQAPKHVNNPLIYEAHIGMATEEERIGTYVEFRTQVLPRIAALGYNVIQLMAIQEHPYYGSFGYQVSNFYAPSSRFGTPDELKELIDEAHGMGIAVIMDIVHSHAVKNEAEGLGMFDGTNYLYFHSGPRGLHPVWDSRCFDYGKNEVLGFLLSNCNYWLQEFRFDGFRFDGVTSMLYTHHGLGVDFLNYGMYYDGTQDEDAITYLALANKLIKEVNPNAISIAEDVSGMPGLAAPFEKGGFGFDFRMSMGVADFWIRNLKTKQDEEWHVGDMFYELTNKRADERSISYAECHDQAMVGDKTIIFWLLDKEMYTGMNVFEPNLTIDRGTALHKLIRMASLSTAGDGYLNFMGNEYGNPEWIDFPREGNGWSYKYARRQWSLSEDKNLRYRFLLEWDKAMIHLARKEQLFDQRPFAIVQSTADQVLIFKRGKLVFAFNFNPKQSFTDYAAEIDPGKYQILLCSDSKTFGGFERVDTTQAHLTTPHKDKHFLKLYLPNRTVTVLKKAD